MATLVSTLYPPTVDTFQKAFINTEDAIVYFTLSSFNSASEIKHVHVTCVNQLNNENALNAYSGVLIQDLTFDKTSGMYYVTIPASSMSGNQFNSNQFYKVQLRFDSYDGTDVPINDEKKKNEYLLSFQQYFSEWSSVCLIRPIREPQIHLNVFDNHTGNNSVSLSPGLVNLTGGITFEDNTEKETLQAYKFEVLSGEDILLTTPTLYTADSLNPNMFSYNIDLSSLKNKDNIDKLTMRLTVRTKNQYQTSKDYKFVLNGDLPDDGGWNPTITAELDDETASVTIKVSNTAAFNESQILYVSRASSEDNFKTWENLYVGYIQDITGNKAKMIVDNTINSMVWYKYRAQLQGTGGLFYPRKVHDVTSVILPQFYDAFLTRGDKQYCIRYNYKVSSFKPTVNRTKIDTLGSKYPRFAENAILNYKQFSISGTIAAESDVYQEFLKKSSIYTDTNSLSTFYTAYKNQSGVQDIVRNDVKKYEKNGANQYPSVEMPSEASQLYLTTTRNDWMWEREFREQLIQWLNDGEPKLYRSMAEGAMVVMLTDISLTPNDVTGRLIWDFSATVYEIAEATSLDDLISLGIYNGHRLDSISGSGGIDDDEKKDYLEVIAPGQTYQWTVDSKNDIRDSIQSELIKKYSGVLSGKRPFDIVLKDVKIFFHNEPNAYYFAQNANGLPQLVDIPRVTDTPSDFYYELIQQKRIEKGYCFSFIADGNVDQIQVFVNERGYYQFPSKVSVKSLSFDNIGDVVTIEYTLCYKTENSSTTVITGSTVDSTVVGQLQDSFQPYEYLGTSIKSKYSYVAYSENVKSYQKSMRYWKGICLDVTPFAMVNIKYHDESDYHTYEVGSTGVLHFMKNFQVDDMCFIGRRMKQVDKSRVRFMREWEYVVDDSAIGDTVTGENLTWFSIQNVDSNKPVIIYQDNNMGNDSIVPRWIATSASGQVSKAKSYKSTKDIVKPQYNTVYGINGKLKIYYRDGRWYDFKYLNIDDIDNNKATQQIGLAAVPIDGIVSYYGQVLVTNY